MKNGEFRSINGLRYYEIKYFRNVSKYNGLKNLYITITQGKENYTYSQKEIEAIIKTMMSKLQNKVDSSKTKKKPFAYIANVEDTDKINKGKHVHIMIGIPKSQAKRVRKLINDKFLERQLIKTWPQVDIHYRFCDDIKEVELTLKYNFKQLAGRRDIEYDYQKWTNRLAKDALPYFYYYNKPGVAAFSMNEKDDLSR